MYGLINLASAQIQPNVLAIMSLARNGLLSQSLTLYTQDSQSEHAARQMHRLWHDLPGVSAKMPHTHRLVAATGSGVFEASASCMAELPTVRWILNTTGGNKLMSAGLMLLSAHPQVQAVIYRDIDSGWVQWTYDPGTGAPIEKPLASNEQFAQAFAPDETTLDRIPLARLLKAQHKGDSIVEFHSRPLPDIDLQRWAMHACVRGGKFRTLPEWSKATTPHSGDGFAFEAFVGLILQSAGCRQIMLGCEGQSAQRGKVLESDVVACHGDKLALYDIKLTPKSEPGKSERIRSVKATAEQLAGLNMAKVLVRPNWSLSADLKQFARDLGVTVIDRHELGDFPSALCRPLGLTTAGNEVLQQVQRSVRQRAASRPDPVFPHN